MNPIKLNLINQSNSSDKLQVVVFQKNEASAYNELAIAWHVFSNLGYGDNHPFAFGPKLYVAASDSFGNYTPKQLASGGQAFSVINNATGDAMKLTGQSEGNNEIDVINGMKTGAVNACIYRDGLLLATQTGIPPGQKAVFSFNPTIWIGVASQAIQGEVMNSAILSQVNTEISLFGIQSADIIMSGGGPGQSSTPFIFTLANVAYA